MFAITNESSARDVADFLQLAIENGVDMIELRPALFFHVIQTGLPLKYARKSHPNRLRLLKYKRIKIYKIYVKGNRKKNPQTKT